MCLKSCSSTEQIREPPPALIEPMVFEKYIESKPVRLVKALWPFFAISILLFEQFSMAGKPVTHYILHVCDQVRINAPWVLCSLVGLKVLLGVQWSECVDSFFEQVMGVKFFVSEVHCETKSPEAKTNGVRRTSQSLSRVTSSSSILRLSESLRGLTMNSRKRGGSPTAISGAKLAYPVDEITAMTLEDVCNMFTYSIQLNRAGFDMEASFPNLSSRARRTFAALERLSEAARGPNVKMSSVDKEQPSFGDMDVLQFIATLRFFAEWRNVRLVPEGYKKYGWGLSAARLDLVKNIQKIENAAHQYLDVVYNSSEEGKVLHSPTLQQLLLFELDRNVHRKLPKLAEQSAAMGVLWSTRQLQYFSCMMSNIKQIPENYETMTDALSSAYLEVYSDFHGWALKHVFQQSFHGMPSLDVILKQMKGGRPVKTVESTGRLDCDDSESDGGSASQLSHQDHNVWENVVQFVGKECEFFGSVLKRFNCHRGQDDDDIRFDCCAMVPPPPPMKACSFSDNDTTKTVSENADLIHQKVYEDISMSLEVMQPLVHGLIDVLKKYNMNDASKV